MHQFNCMNIRKKALLTFFTLLFIAIFSIGGCNDGNNGGNNSGDDGGGVGAPGPDTSACAALSAPCATITQNDGVIECVLSDASCVVDLDQVISQLQGVNTNLSDSSRLFMGAWGGNGGSAAENGGDTSPGGYAQTTTNVSDIVNLNNGSSLLYYFLGEPGGNAPGHCGGGGGASTIVTFEDLTLNPGAEPTSSLLFMIAGGGGGAGGGTIKGCSTPDGPRGAEGGITITTESGTQGLLFNAGAGCNGTPAGCGSSTCSDSCTGDDLNGVFIGEGGGGSQSGTGGQRMCCIDNQTGSGGGAGIGIRYRGRSRARILS